MRANPYERLATVYQEKSVDEYIDVFVALASQVEGLTDQQYLGFFLSGLREEIRVRIHSQDSVNIFSIINLAREIELEIQFLTSKLSLKHGGDSNQRWGSVIGPGPRNDMDRVQSIGVCHDVKINLGNLEISVDCYVFPLRDVDLILGVAWLATLGGHSGAFHTYKRLASNLYYRGMLKSVKNFVAECLTCQKHKYEASSPAGLL
ncbi:hypothetical protein GH714_040459 [Hevea brasiliensis]|uniref:Integrase zinc-binding domain-containing protein n=1 Tax=Hevea brasiliensis TaxID=3981 RepID=A0A6A6KET4_HEVBR|nr:hypothetical protein GH714_040459 [Hevea brasiliensis]